jgi:hypothetical protein
MTLLKVIKPQDWPKSLKIWLFDLGPMPGNLETLWAHEARGHTKPL